MEEARTLSSELGSIHIADEVISIIAGLAVMEIDGVASMSGGVAGGIAKVLGKKNLSRVVKVETGEEETAVDLYIIINYGSRIPDVTWAVQEKVKKAIENMTGLKVVKINVHVQGVIFSQGKVEAVAAEETVK